MQAMLTVTGQYSVNKVPSTMIKPETAPYFAAFNISLPTRKVLSPSLFASSNAIPSKVTQSANDRGGHIIPPLCSIHAAVAPAPASQMTPTRP